MNIKPTVGEVWFADLGIAAKSRPVLILSAPRTHDARHLVVVAPLTSQIRSLRGEVPLGPVQWLPKLSAVNVQGIASFNPSIKSKNGYMHTKANGRSKTGLTRFVGAVNTVIKSPITF